MNYNHDPWIREIYGTYMRPITVEEHKTLTEDPQAKDIADKVKYVLEHKYISCNLSRLVLRRAENMVVPDKLYFTGLKDLEYVISTRKGRKNSIVVDGFKHAFEIDDETYERIQQMAVGRADPVHTSDFIRTPHHFNVIPGMVFHVNHDVDIYRLDAEGNNMLLLKTVSEGCDITIVDTNYPGWLVVNVNNEHDRMHAGKIPMPEFYDALISRQLTAAFDAAPFYE